MSPTTQNHTRSLALLNRQGLSLLEVIIATVVLAVSTLMLIRIITGADRTAQRAEQRIMAQMICQNKLDEIVSGIEPLESFEPRPSLYYPNWFYSVTFQEKMPDSDNQSSPFQSSQLVLIEVSTFYHKKNDEFGEIPKLDLRNEKPVFSLRRLVRRPVPQEDLIPGSFSEGTFQ